MKKNNLWRIIWIIGIYAILILILYLVITYKVKWENIDLNKYIYFYECSNNLCTSITEPDEFISKIKCDSDICPYIKEIKNNDLILTNGEKSWIYNYQADKIINDLYIDYQSISNNNYIVTNEEQKQGIIDLEGNILIDLEYKNIKDYQFNYLVTEENNKYGIIKDKEVIIKPEYEDIILINDKLFAAKIDGSYQIYNYDNNLELNNNYTYIYPYKDIILVIADKKIDILNTSTLNSILLLKINAFYEYNKVGEIDTLKINTTENDIYFSVYNPETSSYTNYTYDIKNKKLR